MFSIITNNWNRHRLLGILKRQFEKEEWNSLVKATTAEEIEEFLNVTHARFEKLIRELILSGEIVAVDNQRAFLFHPQKGMRAIGRQKYLQRIYRVAGIGASAVMVVLVLLW